MMIALGLLALSGCGPTGDAPLVIATTWPTPARAEVESAMGGRGAIEWVLLGPDDRVSAVLDRRRGVDLLLGIEPSRLVPLADRGRLEPIEPTDPAPWRPIHRPGVGGVPFPMDELGDPRDDPSTLARAKATLESSGWPEGWARLVRGEVGSERALKRFDAVALVRTGRNLGRARQLIRSLATREPAEPPGDRAISGAIADGLLADLLGSALFGARDERIGAIAALRNFHNPARAEEAMAERPPWPPASILKLRAQPGGGPLVETLAEHVAPDPEARAWLLESWTKPRQMIDAGVLDDLARAANGKLAREPRFRAWLRSEWTAWNRQLYRRVARLAGGYVPS